MSIRSNGSYIGPRPTGPSSSAASGIWDLRTAERQQRAAAWPAPIPVPQTISGLQLWLDASAAGSLYDATSGGSLVAADGGVARWEDKSGNARHATQGTSGNRPLRKTAIQGGKDVLRFDGSNDLLTIGDAATFKFLHSADSTVFIALTRSSNSGSAIMGTADGGTGTVGWTSYFFNGTSTNDRFGLILGRGQSGVAVSQVNSGSAVISSGWNVLSFVSKPTDATAANRASLRQNGGTAAADNAATGTVSANNSAGAFTIGAYVGFAADYGGDIAEIIIYNSALSDTDREAVESYLMTKWGIS